MFSRQSPRQIFLSAISLLILSGIATGFTIYKLYESETWVRHTFRVQLNTHEIETNLAKAGRLRQGYLSTNDPKYLQDLAQTRTDVFAELRELRSFTGDNRDQQRRCDRLEQAIVGRLAVIEKSVKKHGEGPDDAEAQVAMLGQILNWAYETETVIEEMNRSEEALLNHRIWFTSRLFLAICLILAATFLISIYLFKEYYGVLNAELKQRTKAEENAQRLTVELLRAQDEERRRISRELHDGLGQTLAGAKMLADSFLRRAPSPDDLNELTAILDEAVSATRTLSHLLYPPMLDEIGFISAARWFVEGFSKRAGIEVTHDIPEEGGRFSAVMELTMFRVLQESLMNVQKHSKSKKANVNLKMNSKNVRLTIQDFGVGLPREKLNNFQKSGTDVGVGLAGMKQRVLEQSGSFTIVSDERGTVISVVLPTGNRTS
ncbi:MAG TPA: CHASE3 domain-containing protein [Candidatus Saccharimonadales bacterium]|nr:CHASE3 domain-containing protein [Candidatus Saccharimonadales bacterium]